MRQNTFKNIRMFLCPYVHGLIFAIFIMANSSIAQQNYYLRNHEPWPYAGPSTIAMAMDAVFGTNYIASDYSISAATVFNNNTHLVYMEGGEDNDIYMKAFLETNRTLIESWVSNGGRLFLNSAGWNTGMDYGFGGVTLVYPGASGSVTAADPNHAIFLGSFTPTGSSFTGSSYSHDYITGTGLTNIILGTDVGNAPVLASKNWGAGLVLFGGITAPVFHYPKPNGQNLFQNILAFLNAHVGCPANLGLTASVTHVSCPGGSNGAIDLSVSNGVTPYTYAWSNLASSEDISGLTAGDYTVEVADANGCKDKHTVKVNDGVNSAPVINSIACPADPLPLSNAAITISVNYSDNENNVNSTMIDWGDGTTPSSSTSHTYTKAGVYAVAVTLGDACGETAFGKYEYIVVYDPSGGFVTGGGWINSPEGAYVADPALTGKANFGFVSKYEKGKTVPSGNTEFQFHAGGLNFRSSSYEWLVISGSKGQFKGAGTINGTGNYGFLLSAQDGDLLQSPTTDKFRIKIWDKTVTTGNNVVYDNQMGDADDAVAATPIGGGSIVIHASKSKATTNTVAKDVETPEQIYNGQLSVTALPNPSKGIFTLQAQSGSTLSMHVRVLDVLGRVIETRRNVAAHSTFSFGNSYRPGVYYVEVVQGTEKRMLKLVKQ